MIEPIFACLMMCGQQVVVEVQAAAAPDARRDVHFAMTASDPHVRPSNPDFIAIARAVSRALASQGFEEAASPDKADLTVVIDWMVSDPKMTLRHAGGDMGRPVIRGAAPGGRGGMPAGGTDNNAAFGFGMEGSDRGELVYQRVLTLKGVDRAAYAADPAAQPLWALTLKSDGNTDSVPEFAPQMVAAAIPYVAQNAGKAKVRLGAAEAPVKYVRGEIPALPSKK